MSTLSGDHMQQRFEALALGEQIVRGASFDRCTFHRCRFEKTRFSDVQFTDCVFQQCDLVGVRFPDTAFVDCTFEGGRAMGTDFSRVRTLVFGIGFRDVVLDYSNFSGLPLRKTVFESCRLREAVFSECDLSGASFPRSDLSDATIRRCNLTGTDFESSTGCAFDVATCTLKNTKVDGDTARFMLQSLGVVCSDLSVPGHG
jgi:fluoroquinolone resistance protein